MIGKCLALLACAFPAANGATTFTILDEFTDEVPTGTSYEPLTEYNQYVDAGSVDASPFVIDKTTNHEGGILFYGSTELISGSSANTFRLTSSTGLFDFVSFEINFLEIYQTSSSEPTPPNITVTSSTGFTQSFFSEADGYDMGEGQLHYSYSFFENGVKELNWDDVEWVDITTQYSKAKVQNFVLVTEIAAVPEPSSSIAMGALLALGMAIRSRRSLCPIG